MKKLDTRTYRLHKLIDYTGVVLLVLLLLFIWQLYRGPIAMPFLKPYIIKALNHDDAEYQVTLDSVNLELVRSIKPLRIIANNVSYRKNDGEFIITAPKTSVSFSIKALLRGVIAPSSVEVNHPSVYIFTTYGVDKDKQEEFTQKKLEYYFEGFEEFIERFNSEDKTYPESYINDINISNAEVEFHEVDLGRKWVFSDLNYRFERNFTNIETEVNALLKFNDKVASLGLEAVYKPAPNKIALQIYFSDLVPSDVVNTFAGDEQSQDFYKINLPLNGKINTLISMDEIEKNRENFLQSLDTAIEKVQFSFEGGQGNIAFSADEEYNYDVSAFLLEGELNGGLDKVKIENAVFDLDGQKMNLSLNASGMKNYLLKDHPKDLKLSLIAQIASLKFDDLSKYWPRYIASDAWNWCKTSLFVGMVQDAVFNFDFAYDDKSQKFGFSNLRGSAKMADVTLDYLTGMPRITNMYGHANFSPDSIDILVDKGVSDNVLLNNGRVRLYDLNKYNNYADISLQANGNISDILRLIDNKPLNYTSDMGLNPDAIKGQAEVELSLNLELKKDLGPDEVNVKVKSKLANVEIPDVIDNKSIHAKELDMSVTNAGLLVTGDTIFEDIPIKLVWDENFADKNYKSRYKLAFSFDDSIKKKLGIDVDVLGPPYIVGAIPSEAVITSYDGGRMGIDLTGNLQSSLIDYSFLGFKKPNGEKGIVKARIEFLNNKLKAIPEFSLSKQDFNLKGKINLDAAGKVRLIDISDIKGPKTDARAQIELINTPKKKIKINVSGNNYNLSDFFDKDNEEITAAKERRRQLKLKSSQMPEDDDELEKVTDTDIYIAVNRLWTTPDTLIRNFAGSANLRKGIGVNEMHMIGNFGKTPSGKERRLKLDYIPRAKKEFLLNIESNDAGSTFRFLRVYNNMRGGDLSINAKRGADKQFVGHAKIRHFSISNTPILAKLLTVASLTGMVNLLTGEGITFSHFDAPFEYKHKMLTINDGKAFGDVMGITMKGTYSNLYQEFDVKGVIAPAYTLNTLIGKIPVVGNLLSGKDGTVFAANYTITGDVDDPIISINPLSALSPSSLKDMFSSMFGSK